MNNYLQSFTTLLLLAVLCAGSSNLFGQSLVSTSYRDKHSTLISYANEDDRQEPGESVRLESVLEELETDYKIHFAYDGHLVSNKYVPVRNLEKAKGEAEDVEVILHRILEPLELKYTKVNKVYVLYKAAYKEINPVERNQINSNALENEDREKLGMPEKLSKRSAMLQLAILQDKTITGNVTDENDEPLPGVNIVVKGTTTGTISDVNGNYRLTVSDDAQTLVFSSVGYVSEEIAINDQPVINLQMVPDIQSLSEVVVVGYGTQKRSDLTGAISSISSEDLAETPAGNVLEQSQGRLAGVDIVRDNGSPGSPVQIRIRGNRSINASNEPLYVIDGIPTSANINNFNPNDIESMEVLKDASAVAIYGSRGANGVILITTKKGKEGKAVISYDGYYGVKQPIENLDLMNGQEFAAYSRVSRGIAADDSSQDATFFSDIEINNLQNGIITDWLDEVIRSGTQQDHQVSVSGGSEDITYYLSGSYFDEEGIIENTDFSRVAVRANIEGNLTDKLTIGVSSTVAHNLRNQMNNSPFNNALGFSPLVTPYDENGEFVAYPNPREGLLTNPLLNFQPNQYRDETKSYRIFANIFATYDITDDLTFRLNYGPDYSSSRRGRYTGSLAGSTNTASVENESEFVYTLENILTYDKTFGDHVLNVVGLFSTQKSNYERSIASAQDIPIEKSTFNDLGSASTITEIGSSLLEWGLLSYMGRINYSFKNRYLFTLTGRADGSSRLAEGKKWAFFPAVSAGWIISEENFFDIPTLSFLKIRASYGEVGNTSIDPYQTLGGLARTIYAFGNNEAFGYGQSLIRNPDLGWEISKTTNVGLDFGFLEDRITGTFEYYNTNTEDLLLERFIPITSGYSSILQNIGSTRNRGWELTLSSNIINNPQGVRWDVNLNVFSNKEEIVELFDGQSDDVGNQWFIGQPIDVFYSFQQAGIWQQGEAAEAENLGQAPGDIKIADVNGRDENGELTKQPDGQINSDDRTVLGSTVPDWSGGITNRISYKGLDLSVLVYARQGQFLRSDYHNLGGNNWQGRYNSLNLDFWTPDNPTHAFPLPDAGEAPLYSDAVRYFDGSFVKIKNITLGYNFPTSLLNNLGLSSLRLYTTVNNAITFSEYDVVDPETSNGIVGGGSPLTSATYIFGINLKF